MFFGVEMVSEAASKGLSSSTIRYKSFAFLFMSMPTCLFERTEGKTITHASRSHYIFMVILTNVNNPKMQTSSHPGLLLFSWPFLHAHRQFLMDGTASFSLPKVPVLSSL